MLALIGIGLVLAESVALIGAVYVVFWIFKWSKSARGVISSVVSYPGTFVAVGGWIGFAVPVPLLIGGPFGVLILLVESLTESSPHSAAGWYPVPLFGLITSPGSQLHKEFVLYEIGSFAIWLVLSLLIFLVGRCGNRLKSTSRSEAHS